MAFLCVKERRVGDDSRPNSERNTIDLGLNLRSMSSGFVTNFEHTFLNSRDDLTGMRVMLVGVFNVNSKETAHNAF